MNFNTEFLPKRSIKKAKELQDTKYSRFEINGYGSTSGGKSNKFQINGSGSITEDLHTNKLEINGHATLDGNVEAQRTEINGYTSIGGSLVSNSIEVNGVLKTKLGIDSENMKVQGKIDTTQILSKNVDMSVYVGSKINSIVAFKANLRGYESIFSYFMPQGLKNYLPEEYMKNPTLNGVVAHSLVLKDMNCDYVGGNHVKIKGNSEIKHVEYTHTLSVEEGAKVNHSTKIESDFNFERYFGIESELALQRGEQPRERGSIYSYIEKDHNDTPQSLTIKLEFLNIALLKKICGENFLSEEGTKAELIERLINSYEISNKYVDISS